MTEVDFSDPAIIAELAAALRTAGIDAIEIERSQLKIRIVLDTNKSGSTVEVDAARPADRRQAMDVMKAPMAGYFDHSPEILAALPRKVQTGEILGLVRVGPVLLPVMASRDGMLNRCLAEAGSIVGYGDPLFEIEPRA